MFPWSWFDNRTLFSCQFLLALAFTVLFFGMRRANPNLRGIATIALSFLFSVVGILLLFLRGAIPDLLSMLFANGLVLVAFTLQYRATLRFLGVRRRLYPIWILNAVTLIIIFYYSEIKHDIVLRIIAASIPIAILRACIARELFRQARGRTHMRLFAYAMTLFALLSCTRGVVSYLNGAPENYMQTSSFQTIAMVGDLIYICVVGLFFFTMINNRMLELIRDQSEQDPLSGIFNRRAIEQRLSSELRRITRNAQKLSIALIDIDYFKTINDTSGHAAGDDALRAVVDSIAGQLRSYDMLGRYGGDEFLLILPQTRCTDAFIAVERIRQAVSSFSHKFYSPSLTLSIGLSEAIPGENAASLLSRADQALYEAKRAGRNCTRFPLQVHTLEMTPALEPSSSVPSSRINLI